MKATQLTRMWLAITAMMSLAACDGAALECAPAELGPLPRAPAFVAVTSDYASSAIALVDADGQLITEAWIDSGTRKPGVAAALGGDVVLPSTPSSPGVLTLIERLGVDVLTRISVERGEVIAQIPTQLPFDEGGVAFRANPHDFYDLGDGTAVVTRYNPNLAEGAPALDRGNDLVLIDLARGTLSDRIDLSAFDRVEGAERYYARPDRIARAGDYLVVGLGRLSFDFMRAGEGAVAIVDVAARTASVLELGELHNCGDVSAVPDAPGHVLVLCAGDTFTVEATRRPNAGIAEIAVDASGQGSVVRRYLSREHTSDPVASIGITPLPGGRALAAATGDRAAGAFDRLIEIDLSTGATRILTEARDVFVIGSGVFDARADRVLVPMGGEGVVEIQASTGLVRGRLDVSPCRGLEAREVRGM